MININRENIVIDTLNNYMFGSLEATCTDCIKRKKTLLKHKNC